MGGGNAGGGGGAGEGGGGGASGGGGGGGAMGHGDEGGGSSGSGEGGGNAGGADGGCSFRYVSKYSSCLQAASDVSRMLRRKHFGLQLALAAGRRTVIVIALQPPRASHAF